MPVTIMTPSAETAALKANRRRWLVLLAKLFVAGGLLVWLLASGRLDLGQLRQVRHVGYLVLALAILLVNMVLPVWRWMWLLKVQGLIVPWRTAAGMTWLGYFAAIFLPGAAGGDLPKAVVACRHQPDARARAVSTVILDRLLGLHSMLFVGGIAGVCVLSGSPTHGQAAVAWLALAALAVSSAGMALLLARPTSDLAMKILPKRFRQPLADSLARYRRSWRALAGIWLFSGLCSLTGIASYLPVTIALGLRPSAGQVVALPLVIVANSLPISPGGLGVGEAVGSELFDQFGLPGGGMIVLLVRLGVILLSAPGALAILGRYRPRQSCEPIPDRQPPQASITNASPAGRTDAMEGINP